MKFFIYLRLGRVSNLPTVWTNVLAGSTLAGAPASPCALFALCAILSAFYVGGMFLNDAFDRHIDKRERPNRPIPAGLIRAGEVFRIGFGLLALGVVGLAYGFGLRAGAAGLGLAATIVLYNAWHKGNPISPVIMGACRALVYAIAALAVAGELPREAILGALALWSYLIALTYIAKQETLLAPRNLWPAMFVFPVFYGMSFDFVSVTLHMIFFTWILGTLPYLLRRQPGDVPQAVLRLLAGICLLDAAVLSDRPLYAAIALGCFALTRRMHRSIPGT